MGVSVVGVNQYKVGDGSKAAVEEFQQKTGATFPLGDDLLDTYPAFNANATGSSPNGVYVVVDRDGIIRHLTRNYDEAAIVTAIEQSL